MPQTAAEFADRAKGDPAWSQKNQHIGWTTLSSDIVFGLA